MKTTCAQCRKEISNPTENYRERGNYCRLCDCKADTNKKKTDMRFFFDLARALKL